MGKSQRRAHRIYPKTKMGAGVATGPHLSRVRTAAPVRAWRLSWAGRTSPEQAPRKFGVPAEILRSRSVPYEHLSGEPDGYPFAVPSAEASGPAGSSKKLGSACASHFFIEVPSIAPVACDPKITDRVRGGRFSELSFLAVGLFLVAKCHTDSASRVAPSGIWAPCPVDYVDNVDNVDKSAYSRFVMLNPSTGSGQA